MAWTYSLTYTQVNDYSVKDGLSSGNAEKIILGADIDAELSGIATALNEKLDSGSVSSVAEAQAGTDAESVITPQRLTTWSQAGGGGHVGELWNLTDPAADRILFYDFSAGAGSMLAQLTVGDGLQISATTLQIPASIAGDGLAYSSGVLSVGGGNGITANANDVALTDAAATTSNPIDVSSGAITLDITALTNIEGSALAATDEFVVDDAGTPKAIAVQDMGYRVQTSQGTQNLAANDMNTIMKFTAASTLTIDTNATTDIPLGVPVVLINDHASASVTVTANTGVTLESVFHAGGASAESDVVLPGGMAILVQTQTNVWQLAGDIADS